MLVPSPIHPVWTSQIPSFSTLYTATYGFAVGLTNVANDYEINIDNEMTFQTYTAAANAPQPALYGTKLCFYAPKAGTLTISGTGFTGSGSVTPYGSIYNGPAGRADEYPDSQPVGFLATTISGGNWTTSVTVGGSIGWFYLQRINSNTTSWYGTGSTVSISYQPLANRRYLLPAFGIIEQSTLQAARARARVTANALLLTNTSNAYYRGGQFYAAQLSADERNIWDVDSWPQAIGSRNQNLRYTGPGDKGLYTYTIPNEGSMKFSDYQNYYATGFYVFQLEDTVTANCAYYISSAVNPITSGVIQDFEFVYDEHTESRITSQIFQLAPATMPLQLLADLQASAATHVPFTENPGHWRALSALVRRTWPLLRPHVRTAARRIAGAVDSWLS